MHDCRVAASIFRLCILFIIFALYVQAQISDYLYRRNERNFPQDLMSSSIKDLQRTESEKSLLILDAARRTTAFPRNNRQFVFFPRFDASQITEKLHLAHVNV